MEITIELDATAIQQPGTNLTSGSRESSTLIPAPLDSHGEIITRMHRLAYEAAAHGNINFFQEKKLDCLELLTPNKNTVLHIHFTAQQSQTVSEKFTKDILKMCPHLVSQGNCNNETPLHMAARYGHLGIVKILIEHAKALDADPENGFHGSARNLIRATDCENNSALHEAVRFGGTEIVEMLIKEDPNHSYSANNDHETPLYLATVRGYRNVVFKILDTCKAQVACGGPNGRTALHAAVRCGDKEMVEHMLQKDYLKDSVKQTDDDGWTPLHHAAKYGFDSIAKLLLENDINADAAYIRDNEGRTALHIAAHIGKVLFMKVILSHCPDCAELVDKKGFNALHYAVETSQRSVAALILRKPSLSNLFNQKDSEGNTALHLMADPAHFSMTSLIQHPRVDKMALNQRKHTALDIALHNKTEIAGIRKRTVNLLKENGAKPGSSREPFNEKDETAKKAEAFQKAKDSNLVVATLIATVTFAAGFTLPGGSMQEGKQAGSPVLKRDLAFRVFLVSDSIALVLSSSAVFIHLFMALVRSHSRVARYWRTVLTLTVCAMVAMNIAFVTGIYAELGHISGISISNLLIGLGFFFTVWKFRHNSTYYNIIAEYLTFRMRQLPVLGRSLEERKK